MQCLYFFFYYKIAILKLKNVVLFKININNNMITNVSCFSRPKLKYKLDTAPPTFSIISNY